ncbi:glycosyltransferase family 2 protein [Thalassotalea agarivorans]|uniref:Glycosyltransferase involved in cell wall bisynthesis n=1 Tax=Thalassotalea agarivorans TaxID=349064 RepID=A0A1I0DVT0_THASX|nr:glycosyltransferase family 2 protein [Thalassotalea agarivorans]SET36761.1 Glycosyltransferase involved in cell wall bisynthesis [Thalassotalea agarivorans]
MSFSISVVIPFYHAERYFEQAYLSVRAQTKQPVEIIVVNDGCGNAADEFIKQFDGVTLLSLPQNKGVSYARNQGIKCAQGDYIAFLDADDKWHREKLAKQAQFLIENPRFAACHTGIEVFENNEVVNQFTDKPYDLTTQDLLTTSHVTPTSLIVHKQALIDVGFFDENIKCSEDHDLCIKLIKRGHNIGFLKDALSCLRREQQGNLSSNPHKLIKGHLYLLKKHSDLYNQHKSQKHIFLYKTFMSAGGRASTPENKLYYLMGSLIKRIYRINIEQID